MRRGSADERLYLKRLRTIFGQKNPKSRPSKRRDERAAHGARRWRLTAQNRCSRRCRNSNNRTPMTSLPLSGWRESMASSLESLVETKGEGRRATLPVDTSFTEFPQISLLRTRRLFVCFFVCFPIRLVSTFPLGDTGTFDFEIRPTDSRLIDIESPPKRRLTPKRVFLFDRTGST